MSSSERVQFYRPSATSAARSTNEGWLGFRRTFFIESINSRLWVFTLFAIQLLPNCYCYCYVSVKISFAPPIILKRIRARDRDSERTFFALKFCTRTQSYLMCTRSKFELDRASLSSRTFQVQQKVQKQQGGAH